MRILNQAPNCFSKLEGVSSIIIMWRKNIDRQNNYNSASMAINNKYSDF